MLRRSMVAAVFVAALLVATTGAAPPNAAHSMTADVVTGEWAIGHMLEEWMEEYANEMLCEEDNPEDKNECVESVSFMDSGYFRWYTNFKCGLFGVVTGWVTANPFIGVGAALFCGEAVWY